MFNGGGGGAADTGLVVQTSTTLGSVVQVNVGAGSGTNNLHSGFFDNKYFLGDYTNSHLYVEPSKY